MIKCSKPIVLGLAASALLLGALPGSAGAATEPAKIIRYLLPTIKLLNPDGTYAKTVKASELPGNGTDTVYDDENGTYTINYDHQTYLVKQGQVQADRRKCPDNYALASVPKGQVNAGENAGANAPAYQCIRQ